MHPALRVGLVAAWLLLAIPVVLPAQPAAALGQVSVYRSGLNIPIALAFASDGRIFFNERNTGNIRIIDASGALLAMPFITLPNTNSVGERGLLGLALDPGYPSVPYVFAYQTYNDVPNGTTYNRIVRIVGSGNVATGYSVILALPPLSGATNHNGGVIAFGPDDKLYAVVGENANIALAQNRLSPMGKVLRMETDGSPPVDNPFVGNASWNPLIFTYGHRNMFGLAFHPMTGRAYVTENGPNCNDEISLLTSGANYGWGTTQTCTTPPPPPQNTNRDGPNPVMPIWWWGGTICPTNAAIYAGPFFPQYQGDMFMGDCNFRRLHRLHLVAPNYDIVASDTILYTAPLLIMDVEVGPDGAVWFTTPTTIYRYWDSGRPPVASFTATPNPTTPGTPITFDGSGSTDPDGTVNSWAWDFGDGQTATGTTTVHAYATVGTYVAALTVQDNETFTNRTTRTIVVQTGPAPPQAAFTAIPNPASPGMPVAFDGSSSSDSDGFIVSYAWDFGDGQLGAGATTNHAYATVGTYTASLTVTDNQALTNQTTDTIRIQNPPLPPTAAFTISPSPALPNTNVTFNASASTDPDGTIVSYAWDFGDTTTGSGMIVTHQFATGRFTITLTVVDNQTLSASVSHDLLVDAPPRASFTTAPSVVYIGLGVAFDASMSTDPDGPIVSYAWDFGDAASATGRLTAHAYAAKGTFTAALVVTDGFGLTDRTTAVLVVANRPPVITASDPDLGPVSLDAGASRTFFVTATDADGDVLAYAWEVDGVGAGGNLASMDLVQPSTGTHTVRVTVSDGTATVSREWDVTVSPAGGIPPTIWWPVAIVLAVIVLVIVLAWWQRRRKDRSRW